MKENKKSFVSLILLATVIFNQPAFLYAKAKDGKGEISPSSSTSSTSSGSSPEDSSNKLKGDSDTESRYEDSESSKKDTTNTKATPEKDTPSTPNNQGSSLKFEPHRHRRSLSNSDVPFKGLPKEIFPSFSSILLDNSAKRPSRAIYTDPGDLVPKEISKAPQKSNKNLIKPKDISLNVDAPSIVETTPGQFSVKVSLENRLDKEIKNLSVGISFDNNECISLIHPFPQVNNITLDGDGKKFFSFNVKVNRIDGGNKIISLCVYLYSSTSDDLKDSQFYRISSSTYQIRLNQSSPRKAIIVVPGICGSELFSATAQVIDGRQYSQGYRIWPPEDAADVVEGGCSLRILGKMNLQSADRLLSDFSLVSCRKDGTSKSEIMLSNPVVDCRTNVDQRNFGTVNCYGKLVNSLISSSRLHDYDIVFFSYDWRRSNLDTARALKEFIEAQQYSDTVLIGHSMGGLVCSSLASMSLDSDVISKIILLGSPIEGAAKAFAAMEKGTFFGIVELATGPISKPFVKALAQRSPSVYELLPPKQAFHTVDDGYLHQQGTTCSILKSKYETDDYKETKRFIRARHWATVHTKTFLKNAQKFHDSLYDENGEFILNNPHFKVYNIVGYNSKSLKGFYVKGDYSGKKCKLDNIKCDGDGTVTLKSAMAALDVSANRTYFIKGVNHMGLMSDKDCLNLINNVAADKDQSFNVKVVRTTMPSKNVFHKE